MAAHPDQVERNRVQMAKAGLLLQKLFDEALTPGFHGRVFLECAIQDGVIQWVQEHKERRHQAGANRA